jgi:hypothetical protein
MLRRSIHTTAGLALLALSFGSCGRDAAELLPAGVWGGMHWILAVRDDGRAHLEGDCAHATIERPIEVGAGGAVGFEFGLAPDPIVERDPPGREVLIPARVTGRLEGRTLSGQLRVAGNSVPFVVEHGQPGRLTKCLAP